MLGFLLAKAGIEVVVLEKWPDFFRDFRGDTIHPSTMEVLHELGLLEEFLKLPHSETREIYGYIGGQQVTVADFTHLKVHCPFVAFIPQWDFLNFIVKHAKSYPEFTLLTETEATNLLEENGTVVGVKAKSPHQELEIRAELVIGADGRHSTIREKSALVSDNLGVPIDVLWFKLSRKASDPVQSLGHVDAGRIMIMLDRDDYWQCGFVIKKGQFEEFNRLGLESFRQDIKNLAPFIGDRVQEITGWEQIKLLSVTVDHLQKWYKPGLLCIGDAAHAMSPIAGVGINLAIQDAVATANILILQFKKGSVTTADLARVQNRRESPARRTQKVQVFMQNYIIASILNSRKHMQVPWIFKLTKLFPILTRLPARFVGMGFRPEHIENI